MVNRKKKQTDDACVTCRWVLTCICCSFPDYITGYVWNSEPVTESIFWETQGVSFTSRPLDFPTISPGPTSLETAAPTGVGTSAPTAVPAPTSSAPTTAVSVVVESVIDYRLFFGIDPREPSLAEVESLLEQTSSFYFNVLSEEFPELVSVVASFVGLEYDANKAFPIKVEFDLNAYFPGGKEIRVRFALKFDLSDI